MVATVVVVFGFFSLFWILLDDNFYVNLGFEHAFLSLMPWQWDVAILAFMSHTSPHLGERMTHIDTLRSHASTLWPKSGIVMFRKPRTALL